MRAGSDRRTAGSRSSGGSTPRSRFDRRLAPHDIARLARARRALLAAGRARRRTSSSALERGLDAVAAELEAGRVRVRGRRRGHPHGDRAAADRDRRAASAASSTPARSRNDQVATDLALFVRERAERARRADHGADGAAARARRAPPRLARCPATRTCSAPSPSTSATTCSPTSGCCERDAIRFAAAAALDDGDAARLRRARRAQLGARPRADRRASSASPRPSPNSIDAVSNRDFALDYLYAAAICATHLSRLGSEIVLWSSQEFGFCEPADDFSSGSSIMPQKKNPDAAELLRAKAPRVRGVAARRCSASCTRCRSPTPRTCRRTRRRSSTPSTRSSSACEAAEGMLAGLSFDRERLAAAAADEMVAATDVADLLVRRGMPFREAHGVVGGLVRTALESGQGALGARPRRARRALGAARRRVLRGAGEGCVAGLEGLARRHRAEPRSTSSSTPRRRGRWRPSRERARPLDRRLGAGFFERSVHEVARELIGCALRFDGVGGVIVETESYERDDPACHAYVGADAAHRRAVRARRAAPTSTSPTGSTACSTSSPSRRASAAAVLIRALEPRWGVEEMRRRRGARDPRELCSGPGKLAEALGIGLEWSGAPLDQRALRGWRPRPRVAAGGGGGRTADRDLGATDLPWRFCAAGSEFLSRPLRAAAAA